MKASTARFLLADAILVVGFCVATVGAAGFRPVTNQEGEEVSWTEPEAIPLFLGGLAAIFLGGFLYRRAKRLAAGADAEHPGGAAGEFKESVARLRDMVAAIDDRKSSVPTGETRDTIDALLRNEYFDFASRNEEWASLLGFSVYARVWDGVAVAERLLSRAWSMATDGSVEEGFAELPLAREALDRAAAAAEQI